MGKTANPEGGNPAGAYSIPHRRALARAGLWVPGRGWGEALRARALRSRSRAHGRGSPYTLPSLTLPSGRRQGGRARFRGWAGRRRGRRTGFTQPLPPAARRSGASAGSGGRALERGVALSVRRAD